MTDEEVLEDVASLLEDDCARGILAATSTRPMTAKELQDQCSVSGPTIYRRIEDLTELDLIEASTRPDTDGGHHEQMYVATLSEVSVRLQDGSYEVTVDRREPIADRFTRLVEEM
ncbi:Transcriptional regulator containing HTH domain,ArsR family [Halorhabdus sp. SVX81]|uniref:ArsR/SmtB family transcription factor n=1 Tax=Halorhabdus sp. SVX81 TaxID=2978283 RepID=UPI0023DC5772|nr:helix-turn-helix domain-containing protein [Halorhabdus sp. SVX81]WEL17157.1 Transcriptional regulator containing HTH domain,ArsR family [Halorhabdus sp. SVX81]